MAGVYDVEDESTEAGEVLLPLLGQLLEDDAEAEIQWNRNPKEVYYLKAFEPVD